MRLLLDQGLPRTAAGMLREAGIDAVHTSECDLAQAFDAEILDAARGEGRVVATLDADFHALMALSGARRPSVIRIRVEGLRADAVVDLLLRTISLCGGELEAGSLVSVESDRVRLRRLPIEP